MQMAGIPFLLTGAASGGGTFGLGIEDSNLTLAGNISEVYLDPYVIGGRVSNMASYFQKYRIRGGTITYKCRQPPAQVLEGTTLTTTVAVEQCFGWHPDFFTPPNSFADARRFGGVVTNILRSGASCKIGPSGWLFTTTSSATPDTQDLRQVCFGGFYCFVDNFPSFSATYEPGYFDFSLDIEFQGVQDGAQLGAERVMALYRAQIPGMLAARQRMRGQVDELQASPVVVSEFEEKKQWAVLPTPSRPKTIKT
jgi:hypothetical protein